MPRRYQRGTLLHVDREDILSELFRLVKLNERRLDERLSYIEDDIARLRAELRALREMIEELLYHSFTVSYKETYTAERGHSTRPPIPKQIRTIVNVTLTPTEEEVLRLLIEHPEYGSMGASSIARVLGRTREHIARVLKKLTDKGLLERDESRFPYVYRLSDKMHNLLEQFT